MTTTQSPTSAEIARLLRAIDAHEAQAESLERAAASFNASGAAWARDYQAQALRERRLAAECRERLRALEVSK